MTQTTPTRRRFLQFLVSVAMVHVTAIAAYYGFIVGAPARTRRTFAWAWMGVTVAVVLVGLQRIKRARRSTGARSRQ